MAKPKAQKRHEAWQRDMTTPDCRRSGGRCNLQGPGHTRDCPESHGRPIQPTTTRADT